MKIEGVRFCEESRRVAPTFRTVVACTAREVERNELSYHQGVKKEAWGIDGGSGGQTGGSRSRQMRDSGGPVAAAPGFKQRGRCDSAEGIAATSDT